MILGRSPNLWVGAILAIYGLADVFNIGGFAPTVQQNGVFAIAVGAVVALVANSASIAAAVAARAGLSEVATAPPAVTSNRPTSAPPTSTTPTPPVVLDSPKVNRPTPPKTKG